MNQAEIEKRLEEFRNIGKASFFSKHRDQPPDDSAYASRAQAALAQINRPDYSGAMILWLGTARPELYAELTSNLLDEIQRLWSQRVPLDQFEAVLARLVSLHRQCCDFYRAVLVERSSGNRW